MSVYVALSRGTAQTVIWDNSLRALSVKYGLGLELKVRSGNIYVTHPNGSSLWIVGCGTKKETEKLRGGKYFRVVIDEAQAFPDWLKYFIKDIVEPALVDYRGQLALAGTPSPIGAGYFYEITTGLEPGFAATHHWTIRDNPFLEDGPGEVERILQENQWSEDHPSFVREYLGRWKDDHSSLVYPFNSTRNRWIQTEADSANPYGLPEGEYTYAVGVDLGFSENSTAFVLAAKQALTGRVYVLSAYTRSRLVPSELQAHLSAVRAAVKQNGGSGLKIIIDEGGLGVGWAEQLRRDGMSCHAAEKKGKRAYQDYVADLINAGRILVDYEKARELIQEASKLAWDPETHLENTRYVRHCCDAFLYVTRDLFPRTTAQQGPVPIPGTSAYADYEAKQRKDALVKRLEKERRKASLS
jgi:hypothetical protein